MTTDTHHSPPLSTLRIYLQRRGTTRERGFWGRLFGRSLSLDLAERALRAGVTVTLGHAGFVASAKRVAADVTEIAPTTLPSCVELIGPVAVRDAFIEANREELADAILLRLDGADVSFRGPRS